MTNQNPNPNPDPNPFPHTHRTTGAMRASCRRTRSSCRSCSTQTWPLPWQTRRRDKEIVCAERSRSPFTVYERTRTIGSPASRAREARGPCCFILIHLSTYRYDAQAQLEMQQLAQGGDEAGDPSPRQPVSTGSSLDGPLPMPDGGKFEACSYTHCTGRTRRTCCAPAAATARPPNRCTGVLPQPAHEHSPLRPPRALPSCTLARSLPSCPALLFLQAIKSAYGHLTGALRSLLESNKLRSRMLRHSPCGMWLCRGVSASGALATHLPPHGSSNLLARSMHSGGQTAWAHGAAHHVFPRVS